MLLTEFIVKKKTLLYILIIPQFVSVQKISTRNVNVDLRTPDIIYYFCIYPVCERNTIYFSSYDGLDHFCLDGSTYLIHLRGAAVQLMREER
jgi:hypothetical protein